MLRLAGLLLIAACCSGTGILASVPVYPTRVLALGCLSFVQALCEELRYTLARTEDLLLSLGSGKVRQVGLHRQCGPASPKRGWISPRRGTPRWMVPPSLWNRRTGGFLARGELLGASSAEGQLAPLAPVPAPFGGAARPGPGGKTSKGNLFPQLGMLGERAFSSHFCDD